MRIGFVGAGHIGEGLARLSTTAGFQVTISNSRGPDSLAGLATRLGARAATVEETVHESDLTVVAVPFTRVFEIDPTPFKGRTILDSNNYYPSRDGRIEELDSHTATTSELVQRHFSGATVVKAFNAIMAADLEAPFGLPDRKRALPIAGDDDTAVAAASDYHGRLGFDVVTAGGLAESWRFERAKPCYCIPMDCLQLRTALDAAERHVELPHNSWKRS
jgi:8-hydroxy-5-deazaflavin:NADPH oxidoreductase